MNPLLKYNSYRQFERIGARSNSKPNSVSVKQLGQAYKGFMMADGLKKQTKSLWKIMRLCHKNIPAQQYLCQLLQVPFEAGSISINDIPNGLLQQNKTVKRGQDSITQLQFLFDYLNHVKQLYFCWIIYFNQELGVLNVKLCREDQLQDNHQLFNPSINLIGIFMQGNLCKRDKGIQNQQTMEQFWSQHHGKSQMGKSTSTGCTFKQSVCMTPAEKDVNIKNQLKIRSVSPKMKIISQAYFPEHTKTAQPVKVAKARSFLSRDGKSKSNGYLLPNKLPHPRPKEKVSKESHSYLRVGTKGVPFKKNFRRKSKILWMEQPVTKK